jgi:hypothetical protein
MIIIFKILAVGALLEILIFMSAVFGSLGFLFTILIYLIIHEMFTSE